MDGKFRVEMVDKAKRTTISISKQTKAALDAVKHPGQSYNGLIQELIRFWEQKKGGNRH